jgi:hypothetical protein
MEELYGFPECGGFVQGEGWTILKVSTLKHECSCFSTVPHPIARPGTPLEHLLSVDNISNNKK